MATTARSQEGQSEIFSAESAGQPGGDVGTVAAASPETIRLEQTNAAKRPAYRTAAPLADAVARVREAFQAQGFGVLTEIDVQATLRDKLGVDMEPYLILGARNPSLAHQELNADRRIGLLLRATWWSGPRPARP